MSFALRWNESLATGDMFIDAQHKQLFYHADQLRDAVLAGHAGSGVMDFVNFLDDYIVEHFSSEEGLMEKVGYPELENHKILHEAFKADFLDLQRDIESGINPAIVANEIERRVGDWLQNHIVGVDVRFARWMKEQEK